MVQVTWMSEPPDWMVGQSKKMAAERLPFKQSKIILKLYCKFENMCLVVSRQWLREFATEPPTRLTIVCIRNKFAVDDTMHDVHKQRFGKFCTASSLASSAIVLERFTGSLLKLARHCARETRIIRSSVQLHVPRLLRATNEDDPDRRVHCCEWFNTRYTRKRSSWENLFGLMKQHWRSWRNKLKRRVLSQWSSWPR
jgi:hypothetical protein